MPLNSDKKKNWHGSGIAFHGIYIYKQMDGEERERVIESKFTVSESLMNLTKENPKNKHYCIRIARFAYSLFCVTLVFLHFHYELGSPKWSSVVWLLCVCLGLWDILCEVSTRLGWGLRKEAVCSVAALLLSTTFPHSSPLSSRFLLLLFLFVCFICSQRFWSLLRINFCSPESS